MTLISTASIVSLHLPMYFPSVDFQRILSNESDLWQSSLRMSHHYLQKSYCFCVYTCKYQPEQSICQSTLEPDLPQPLCWSTGDSRTWEKGFFDIPTFINNMLYKLSIELYREIKLCDVGKVKVKQVKPAVEQLSTKIKPKQI